MKKKHWFVPKQYGWGFVPASWEGWLMTFGLVGIIILIAYKNGFFGPDEPTEREIVFYLVDTAVATILFSLFAKRKTKGELRWRWGKKDKDW